MDELKSITDEAGKTLLLVLNKGVSGSSRVLEMSGLEDQFHSAADSLHNYPISTLLIVVHFITILFKIRTSEGKLGYILQYSITNICNIYQICTSTVPPLTPRIC